MESEQSCLPCDWQVFRDLGIAVHGRQGRQSCIRKSDIFNQEVDVEYLCRRHVDFILVEEEVTNQHPPAVLRRSNTLITSKIFSCARASTVIAPAGPAPMIATDLATAIVLKVS